MLDGSERKNQSVVRPNQKRRPLQFGFVSKLTFLRCHKNKWCFLVFGVSGFHGGPHARKPLDLGGPGLPAFCVIHRSSNEDPNISAAQFPWNDASKVSLARMGQGRIQPRGSVETVFF